MGTSNGDIRTGHGYMDIVGTGLMGTKEGSDWADIGLGQKNGFLLKWLILEHRYATESP